QPILGLSEQGGSRPTLARLSQFAEERARIANRERRELGDVAPVDTNGQSFRSEPGAVARGTGAGASPSAHERAGRQLVGLALERLENPVHAAKPCALRAIDQQSDLVGS